MDSWPWMPDMLAIACWTALGLGEGDGLSLLCPPGSSSMPGGPYIPEPIPQGQPHPPAPDCTLAQTLPCTGHPGCSPDCHCCSMCVNLGRLPDLHP